MTDIIKIQDNNGKLVEYNLITVLTMEKYKSSYLVYTKEDIKDYTEVFFAKLGKNNELIDMDDEKEIDDLKNAFIKEMNAKIC